MRVSVVKIIGDGDDDGDGDGDGNDDDILLDEDDGIDGDDNDDDEPPIPERWEPLKGMDGPFEQFLIWTTLTRSKRELPAWHRMVVLQVLKADRKDKFTHDAHAHNEPSTARLAHSWYITLLFILYLLSSALHYTPLHSPLSPSGVTHCTALHFTF